MKFTDLLCVLVHDTFMSVQWDFAEKGLYSYQGFARDYHEPTDDLFVVSMSLDKTNGLIITLGSDR